VLVEVDVDKPAAPLVGFHGQQQSGGCGCSVGDRGSAVGGVLLALLVLGLVIGRPRKTSLAYFAMMALGLALAAGCGSPSDDIDPDDPTVVHPGPTGRWASMATDGQRVVMSAYEQTYGDLVFVDVRQAGQPRFTVIDGAPAAPIVLDPTGYRGGVNEPGANVGAWTSIVVAEGQAWIAYQDLDNHSLRFAAERDGAFITSDVLAAQDSGEVGLFASLVVTPDGRPAIAHLSYSVVTEASEDDAGEPILAVVRTELSWTEALTSAPMSPNDWITTVIESTEAADTLSGNLPAGVGLFASAAITPTGPVVAYYDETAGTLRLARASADGWATELIDGNLDRGQWADLLAINEELYIAYQDASSDSLRVAHIDASGAVTTELVDDGVRGDERRHSVGGSARLVSLGGEIGIAYQDGTTSDLMWAQRANGSWKIEPAMQGPIGYGFFVGAVRAGGEVWLSSFAYDQTMYPPGHTEVTRLSR